MEVDDLLNMPPAVFPLAEDCVRITPAMFRPQPMPLRVCYCEDIDLGEGVISKDIKTWLDKNEIDHTYAFTESYVKVERDSETSLRGRDHCAILMGFVREEGYKAAFYITPVIKIPHYVDRLAFTLRWC